MSIKRISLSFRAWNICCTLALKYLLQASFFIKQILLGVQHLHNHNVAHLDLKVLIIAIPMMALSIFLSSTIISVFHHRYQTNWKSPPHQFLSMPRSNNRYLFHFIFCLLIKHIQTYSNIFWLPSSQSNTTSLRTWCCSETTRESSNSSTLASQGRLCQALR